MFYKKVKNIFIGLFKPKYINWYRFTFLFPLMWNKYKIKYILCSKHSESWKWSICHSHILMTHFTDYIQTLNIVDILYLAFYLSFIYLFRNRFVLCSKPWIWCPPLSACWVIGWLACAIITGFCVWILVLQDWWPTYDAAGKWWNSSELRHGVREMGHWLCTLDNRTRIETGVFQAFLFSKYLFSPNHHSLSPTLEGDTLSDFLF